MRRKMLQKKFSGRANTAGKGLEKKENTAPGGGQFRGFRKLGSEK